VEDITIYRRSSYVIYRGNYYFIVSLLTDNFSSFFFLTLGFKVITFVSDGSESSSLIEVTVLEFVLVVKGQVAVVNRVMKLLVA